MESHAEISLNELDHELVFLILENLKVINLIKLCLCSKKLQGDVTQFLAVHPDKNANAISMRRLLRIAAPEMKADYQEAPPHYKERHRYILQKKLVADFLDITVTPEEDPFPWHESLKVSWAYAVKSSHIFFMTCLIGNIKSLFSGIPREIANLHEFRSYLERQAQENQNQQIMQKISKYFPIMEELFKEFNCGTLYRAASEIISELLRGRIDFTQAASSDEGTPLMSAVKQDNLDLVTFLLNMGATVHGQVKISRDQRSIDLQTAFSYAILHSQSPSLIQGLLSKVKDPIDPINMKYALQVGNWDVVTFLIKRGVLPEWVHIRDLGIPEDSKLFGLLFQDNPAQPMLQERFNLIARYAIYIDSVSLWQFLLSKGFQPDAAICGEIINSQPNEDEPDFHNMMNARFGALFKFVFMGSENASRVGLHHAVFSHLLNAVNQYIQLGHANLVNEAHPLNGETPLLTACSYSQADAGQRLKTIEFLIKRGANVNVCHPVNGDSPLIRAVKYSSFDGVRHSIIKFLLTCDVDLNHKNAQGFSALDLAKHVGSKELVALLEAKLNASQKKRKHTEALPTIKNNPKKSSESAAKKQKVTPLPQPAGFFYRPQNNRPSLPGPSLSKTL